MESPFSYPATAPLLSATALGQWVKALVLLGHALSVPPGRNVIRVRNRIQGTRPTLVQAVGFLCILRTPNISVGDWCIDVGISSGGACNFLDRLESCGLVERIPDPEDGRRILLKPTPRGESVGAAMCRALTEVSVAS